MLVQTGIEEKKRSQIAQHLAQLLAETYTLYLKTQKYHWNVVGMHFQSLHVLFEGQYQDLAQAVDEIAERIRVLGEEAPGSYQEFAKLSSVADDPKSKVSDQEMLRNLLTDHEKVVMTAKGLLPLLDGANDEGTSSLLGNRIEVHEKAAWMLRSSLLD